MSVTREAVIWGFRLFIGREPESEHVISAHMGIKDELTLARLLISSRELKSNKRFSDLIELKTTASPVGGYIGPRISTSVHRMLIIGNCQIAGIARLIQAMTGDIVPKPIPASTLTVERLRAGDFDDLISSSDLILLHPTHDLNHVISKRNPNAVNKIRMIPRIAFSAFHPDMDYIESKGMGRVTGPLGDYHSTIAFYAWKNNFSVKEAIGLFAEDVYENLGFFDYWRSARKSLLLEGTNTQLPLEHLFDSWSKYGPWMYSMNHPKLFALADVARAVLAREGIAALPGVDKFVYDNLADDNVWPVYPEIGKRLGIKGHYQFKMARGRCPEDQPVLTLGLEDFVQASFETFAKYQKDELFCQRLDSSRYQKLHDFLQKRHQIKSAGVSASTAISADSHKPVNPYSNLADYQFWRRAMEKITMRDVDPVVRSSFTLNRTDKVATAGSCFAQHISRTLQKKGFNYFVSEKGEAGLTSEEAQLRNFGVFSARFGNIYTARQLIQLFDRAYSTFAPADQCWARGDGKFADPFRPQVEPEGFSSIGDLESDRARHFSAVREMFESLDVFVFTLGLTEAWRSRVDGAVFPLAPGVVAGEMNPDLYEFVNFNVTDVVTDMQSFIERLLGVNPEARMLLTVSPVPLIATYEDRHVLVSTTYSKSVLRAAAEEISRHNAMCEYFPSYEIITGNYTKGEYFENDLRSVKPEGVEHVMRLFLQHYSSEVAISSPRLVVPDADLLDAELLMENALRSEIICDEEVLDAV